MFRAATLYHDQFAKFDFDLQNMLIYSKPGITTSIAFMVYVFYQSQY
jgi:hypothetical protein